MKELLLRFLLYLVVFQKLGPYNKDYSILGSILGFRLFQETAISAYVHTVSIVATCTQSLSRSPRSLPFLGHGCFLHICLGFCLPKRGPTPADPASG